MDTSLKRALDQAETLDQRVAAIFSSHDLPLDRRRAVTWALCKAAVEHAFAQGLLLGAGLHGSALALIRLQLEATVRAAWTFHVATPEWLEKYATPIADHNLGEPAKVEGVKDMLIALEPYLPSKNVAELRTLYATSKVMHSFVHGGVHAVVHSLRGYPPDKLVSVLINRNLLLWFACQIMVVSTGDLGVAHDVRAAFDQYMARGGQA